jgi:hypothetical protein
VLCQGPIGEENTVVADSLFVLIGSRPHTDWLPAEIARDRRGVVLTGEELPDRDDWPLERRPFSLETSMPGVLAAGDVRHASVKRVAPAVGEGSIAIWQVQTSSPTSGCAPDGRPATQQPDDLCQVRPPLGLPTPRRPASHHRRPQLLGRRLSLPAAVSSKVAGSNPLYLWRRRLRAVPVDLSSVMPDRLATLDALVERSQEVLDAASLKARVILRTGAEFGWEFVSLGPLPEGIASAGLFMLPARSRPTPHRHPNSIQHMRRLSGEARVHLTLGDEVLDRSVGADEPWVVIQADATHQIDVGDGEFVVISFHTVPQEELLEVTETGQRHY